MLPVSADSPSIDSLEPCGQPEQRFPDQLKAARSWARAGCLILRNQFSVPPQQSFRCGDRRYLLQRLASKLFRFGRQSPALIIVQLQTSVTHLFAKNPILLDQICDHFLLMAAHPAGNRRHEKRKWAQKRAHRRIL